MKRIEKSRKEFKEEYKYKVPFRQVYTCTFKDWIKETIWCLFVIKVFPRAHDFETDALTEYYSANPEKMYEQLKFLVKEPKV